MGATAELVLPGAEPEVVGHGLHERTARVPAEVLGTDRREVLTVRDLIDDAPSWERVVEAVRACGHPVYGDDPAGALARSLAHDLDSTARLVPGAATTYGFIPGLEDLRDRLTEIVTEAAPRAAEVPAHLRS